VSKWVKSHKPSTSRLNPAKAVKQSWGALKDDMTPEMPGPTDEETSLRNRQAVDLAKLDDEENRRIKSLFAGGGTRKLFRSMRSARAGSASASSSGAASPGSSGSGSAGGRPTRAASAGYMIR